MEEISDRLKIMMKYRGLKQKEFSKRIGIAPGYFSEILSGKKKPSDKLLRLVCKEFGEDPYWLMYGEGEMIGDKETTAPLEHLDQPDPGELDEINRLEKELREAKAKLSTAEFYRVMAGLYGVLEDSRKERKGDE